MEKENLTLKELVLQSLVTSIGADTVEESTVFCVVLGDTNNFFVIVAVGKAHQTLRVKAA